MRQRDHGGRVHGGVDGAETKHLGRGATGGGAAETGAQRSETEAIAAKGVSPHKLTDQTSGDGNANAHPFVLGFCAFYALYAF